MEIQIQDRKRSILDWNEASQLGLMVQINRDILHPLGLAIVRYPSDGSSPGLAIAEDGVFEYAPGIENEYPRATAEQIKETARMIMKQQERKRRLCKKIKEAFKNVNYEAGQS